MTVCNAKVRAAATESGWSSGITPLPIGERRNGVCVRSIKVRASSSARDQAMPLPTRTSGRSVLKASLGAVGVGRILRIKLLDHEPDETRSGQQKGGYARREKLSSAQRSEIATRAAQARWSREPTNVNLASIKDFQMNTDAIDAADILTTELSEQAAFLSQVGIDALSNGNLAEAKLIISAIEQTQSLCNRADQLKTEIIALHSTLMPASKSEGGALVVVKSDDFESIERKQDRTDPALMNAKRNEILRQLESKHGVRFHRRSAAIYRSDANEIGVVCTMSKWHAKNENYWYAYHPHQDKFLATTNHGYFVLGMMDLELAVVLPLEVIRQNLGKLNTTMTPDGRSYWHIHVSRSENGALSLQRAKGEPPVSVDRYMLRIVPQ
jgi:hypothetical protein